MAESPLPASSARPDFLPASVDYDALPENIRRTLIFVVGPLHEDLVAGACSAAERSAGVALVLLTTLEVIQQFELAQATNFTTMSGVIQQPEARGKLLRDHLRLVRRKIRVARIVRRLRRRREKDAMHTLAPRTARTAHASPENVFSRNRNSDDQRRQADGRSRCQRLPLGPRTAGSCSAGNRRNNAERQGQTQPWAGFRLTAVVSRRTAVPFPPEIVFSRNRDSVDQQRQASAGPQARAGPAKHRCQSAGYAPDAFNARPRHGEAKNATTPDHPAVSSRGDPCFLNRYRGSRYIASQAKSYAMEGVP